MVRHSSLALLILVVDVADADKFSVAFFEDAHILSGTDHLASRIGGRRLSDFGHYVTIAVHVHRLKGNRSASLACFHTFKQ